MNDWGTMSHEVWVSPIRKPKLSLKLSTMALQLKKRSKKPESTSRPLTAPCSQTLPEQSAQQWDAWLGSLLSVARLLLFWPATIQAWSGQTSLDLSNSTAAGTSQTG